MSRSKDEKRALFKKVLKRAGAYLAIALILVFGVLKAAEWWVIRRMSPTQWVAYEKWNEESVGVTREDLVAEPFSEETLVAARRLARFWENDSDSVTQGASFPYDKKTGTGDVYLKRR